MKEAMEIDRHVEGLPKQVAALGQRLEKLSIFLGRINAQVYDTCPSIRPGLVTGSWA